MSRPFSISSLSIFHRRSCHAATPSHFFVWTWYQFNYSWRKILPHSYLLASWYLFLVTSGFGAVCMSLYLNEGVDPWVIFPLKITSSLKEIQPFGIPVFLWDDGLYFIGWQMPSLHLNHFAYHGLRCSCRCTFWLVDLNWKNKPLVCSSYSKAKSALDFSSSSLSWSSFSISVSGPKVEPLLLWL